MTRRCRDIRDLLATEGPQAFSEDDAAQDHLASCDACFALAEEMAELDLLLTRLPDDDAPDELVERLLAHPELRAGADAVSEDRLTRRWQRLVGHFGLPLPALPRPSHLHLAALGALALAAVVVLLPSRTQRPAEMPPAATDEPRQLLLQTVRMKPPPKAGQGARDTDSRYGLEGGDPAALGDLAAKRRGLPIPDPTPGEPEAEGKSSALETRMQPSIEETITVTSESPLLDSRRLSTGVSVHESEPHETPASRDPWAIARSAPGVEVDRISVAADDSGERRRFVDPGSSDDDATWAEDGVAITDMAAIGSSPSSYDFEAFEELRAEQASASRDQLALEAFWAERGRVEGLRFVEPRGYWSTTYLPGDPLMRLLDARLRAGGSDQLAALAKRPIRIHELARPAVQPFDPPRGAALGLYLSSDHQAVTGKSRLFLQVGIQGTERSSCRRGAMSVALVLDLENGVSEDVANLYRALVLAYGEAHDLGDHFSLHVAGDRALEIDSDDFRHGSLSLALHRLFGEGGRGPGPAVPLAEAVAAASRALADREDPDSELGASLLLVATSRELEDPEGELARLAHESVVAGRPMSFIGLGAGVEAAQLDELTVQGGGRRRLLARAAEAQDLIEGELTSASRVVARALRLSIRLAPGVELIEILGSERLDEARTERVREAERSVDLRVARDLGIVMDRGDDEEGVQIVIPAFYAGDSHAILLDVVTPGPGPLAEVTARYKDLVYLRNGTSRATLELARGEPARGTLENNVVLNLLAHRLTDALQSAGDDVRRGDPTAAAAVLGEARWLLAGFRRDSKDFARLEADLLLVDDYLELLDSGAGESATGPLADSLELAAHRKQHGKEKP